MNKRFAIGCGLGILLFILINLLAAHLASDCGLPAVFGRDSCSDDIARAGWPLQFYEEGGFAYHYQFDNSVLMTDLGIGIAFSLLCGVVFSALKIPQQNKLFVL